MLFTTSSVSDAASTVPSPSCKSWNGQTHTTVGTLRNEVLEDTAGDDAISGLGGDDIIDGGTGNDSVNGQVGWD